MRNPCVSVWNQLDGWLTMTDNLPKKIIFDKLNKSYTVSKLENF